MVHGRGSACPDRDWHVAHRSIRPRPTLNTSVIASRGRGTSAAAVAGKRHSRSTTDEEDLIRQAVMCCLLFLGLCAATAAPALARPACTPSGAGQLRCTIRALDDCEEIKSYPLHLPADARDRDLPRRPADRRRREDSELAPGAALPGVVRDRVDVEWLDRLPAAPVDNAPAGGGSCSGLLLDYFRRLNSPVTTQY